MSSQAEAVFIDLRRRSLAGQLRGGTLVEPSNAISFYGLGRTSIFAVFEDLVSEGYIEQDARRRFRGADLSPARVADRFDIGTQLVSIGIQKAAERAADFELERLRCFGRFPTFDQADRDENEEWLVNYVACLRAFARTSKIERLEATLYSFLSPALIRTAVMSFDRNGLLALAESFSETIHFLSARKGGKARNSLAGHFGTLRDACLRRLQSIEGEPTPKQLCFESEAELRPPHGFRSFGIGRREIANIEGWLAGTNTRDLAANG